LHNNSKGFSTPAFQEGFYRFLALYIAEAIYGLGAFKDLSLKIAAPQMPPAEEALCLDIALRSSKHTLWGRIVCPHAFRHAFKAHFSMTPASLSQSSLAKEVSITLRAEVGWTHLSLSRWKEVKVGDFILLDRCSYDPSTNKGTAALALNSTPLLHARLKGESMKIVDYAFYHEETMNENEHFSDEEEPTEPEGEEHLDNEEHLWSPLEKESSSEELISTQEIQLSLTVEVARLKINLDKLLQLRPGNVLELPVRPEQGVDISIGGKKIAKAELIKLGDLLGVKILQLGDQ
jgi:flagellar motor switch protein FliN/FliY